MSQEKPKTEPEKPPNFVLEMVEDDVRRGRTAAA
jgi:hypothetical protein